MKKVLVLEDESSIRSFIVINLRRAGYEVVEAETGEEALEKLKIHSDVRVALLDIMLPGIDGFEVCRRIRATNAAIGIIMLTARSQEMDKVTGLMTGADDYVTKPFSVGELLARIRSALRRLSYAGAAAAEATPSPSVFEDGDLRVDYDAGIVTLAGNEVHLTPIEYKLLCLLSHNVGKVLTHDYILHEVWGDGQGSDLASLRVYMGSLRKKIEADTAHPRYIQTHVGVGYRMVGMGQGEGATRDV